ncbi:MAG: hypothetical protein OXJ64_11840, partial [Boseongicola sp.]|nr:hypothetical protein [Boseongicola sp.]
NGLKGARFGSQAKTVEVRGLHVVMDNNRQWCCQSEQHAPSKRTGEDALAARPAWLHRDVS